MIELNPDDPFDSVIIDMIQMNRKKRNDYAADSDIFSNFRDVAMDLGLEGFGPAESAQVLLLTKVARLKSLRLNGRMANPSNESVLDTYLDLAVYATILLALVKEEGRKTNEEGREEAIKDWNTSMVDLADVNLEAVKEWRARNADSSATEETSRPGPEHVRFRGSVAPSQDEKEKCIRDLYRYGAITNTTFVNALADLRSRTPDGASAEDYDDEDVQSMSSEFRD